MTASWGPHRGRASRPSSRASATPAPSTASRDRLTNTALQVLARIGGYFGPYDGVLGPNSWKGVQTVLTGAGYTGPIDGVPGPNTWKALQRIAQRGGYAGPVDGVPGPNTYAGLAKLLLRSEHD